MRGQGRDELEATCRGRHSVFLIGRMVNNEGTRREGLTLSWEEEEDSFLSGLLAIRILLTLEQSLIGHLLKNTRKTIETRPDHI